MTIIHSLILGVIEGLTEFLPISSTAHLILISSWLKIPTTEFLKTFEISIQLGAILAVVVLYWKKIWSSWSLIGKIITAFIPTSLIGLLLYKIVKSYLMDNLYIIAAALTLGGIILIIFEKYYARKNKNPDEPNQKSETAKEELPTISYKQAAIIGVCQSLAVVPGVSRAAATIVGGLSLGIKRQEIVEFSFLLAIPTMLAATSLDIYKTRPILAGNEIIIWAIGFIASFLTAILGVKFFIKFIQKNDFAPFGWYRIILGLVVFAWLLL
jgi:undecaprenyl-diphosphatase